jgi:hypothetical protein
MRRYKQITVQGKSLFVGIDLHQLQWHVTIRTEDAEIFSGIIPGTGKPYGSSWIGIRDLCCTPSLVLRSSGLHCATFGASRRSGSRAISMRRF